MAKRKGIIVLTGVLILFFIIWIYGQEERFFTGFDSGSADGWELESGWKVVQEEDNFVLVGEGHSWARLLEGETWTNYVTSLRLKLLNGGLHMNFRVSEHGRYFVGFREDLIYLGREVPWGEVVELTRERVPFELGVWHRVGFDVHEGHIIVHVDQRLLMEFMDNDPILRGSIAFETLDDGYAMIDDVEVFRAPGERPPGGELPDLVVESFNVSVNHEFEGREVGIRTVIRNIGEGPADGIVVLHRACDEREIDSRFIEHLAPGEIAEIFIRRGIDEAGDCVITVQIDPENVIEENNEQNNAEQQFPRLEKAGLEGWCCLVEDVFESTERECESMGGRFFRNQEEAEWFRREGDMPLMGWCSRGGRVIETSELACGIIGGRFFMSEEEALEHSRGEEEVVGWCYRDGHLVQSTEEVCLRQRIPFFSSLDDAQAYYSKTDGLFQDMDAVVPGYKFEVMSAGLGITIKDVSPGPGAKPHGGVGGGSTQYGRMLALTASGKEKMVGRPTSWNAPNADKTVEHMAVEGLNHNLFVFYWQPGNRWKAVNVTEKTGCKVVGPVTSWSTKKGSVLVEHVAGRSPNGDLCVFYWEPGKDWKVVNVSAKTGKKIAGAPTSWVTTDGPEVVEHLAARGSGGDLFVFWWSPKIDWQAVNVSAKTGKKVSGDPTSWLAKKGTVAVEHVAVRGLNGELYVFYWEPEVYWKVVDVTAKTGTKVEGMVTSWLTTNGAVAVEHVAARGSGGDLHVFWWTPKDDWQVVNVSAKTGKKVSGDPTSWLAKKGTVTVEHVAVRGLNGELYVFYWEPEVYWKVVDVSTKTGKKIAGNPTSWLAKKGAVTVEHVGAVDSKGNLLVFYWEPKVDWKVVNASSEASSRVLYAAAPLAGVWKSVDYGTVWKQLTRPQPAAGQSTVGGLYGLTVFDVVVSPENPDLVLAAVWDDAREITKAKGGIYRSTDGGKTWSLVYQSLWANQRVAAITQIRFTPDDPKTMYAAIGKGIAMSTDAGKTWAAVEFTGTDEWTRGVWHIAVGPKESSGKRRVYACGDGVFYYSQDGGKKNTWDVDYGIQSIYGCPPFGPGQLVGISPQGDAVHRWNGKAGSWKQIGGPAKEIYAGGQELFATGPQNGDIFRYNRTPLYWTKIGGPGKMFAVDSYGKLYGLSPDGKSVFEYEDKPMTWKKIGNDAGQIYAGGERLFATNPTKGDIYEYNGKAFDWIKIGGPGKMFAVADNGNLYKISTDGQSVWQYENKPLQWKKIGGAATKIAAGKTLYITKPPSNDVYQYDATLASWTKIGHPAKEIYARSVDLFAMSPKNGDIFRYNHTPLSWTKIGGPGKMFAAGYLSTPYYLKFGEKTVLGNGTASLILEVEPGHPDHVYMGFKHFANGPRYFAEKPKPIRVKETDGYQCNTYAPLSASNQKRLGTETLFMGAGEGSVWLGNFSGFKTGSPASQRADWTQLPGPPVYFGVSTPSGRVYASVHPTSSGHLVFFADRSHLHMTTGRPTVNGWHRLDGYDISACWKDNNLNNRMLMHVDPHALVVSHDFNVSLKSPTGVAFMYAKNKVLDRYYNGRIWVANDGGIYSSSDGGKTWHLAYYGPNTLLIVNLAGVVVKGKAPAFYMGMGDNDDYFTMDGGKTWVSQFGGCGDCGHWFADPAHPSRVVELGAAGRRGPYIFSYTNGSGGYPDLSDPKKIQIRMIPHPKDALYNANNGSRVLVCTTVGESSSSPDDYVVIQKKGGSKRILLRAKNLQSHSDMSGWKYSQVDAYWQKNSIWKQVGKKELPANCNLVQASGGHSNTVFFVGDGNKLYRSHRDNKGEVDRWDTIVPGKGASVARRFFVNPYDSKNIYIVDANGVKCWDDKKQTWGIDKSLEKLASENGEYHYNASSSNCILTDMFFYRNDSEQRFAAGTAGVFYTLDGTTWHRVLDTNALPCRPRSVFFDPYERSLYLATEGRGVLKIYPIPKPGS